MLKGIRTASELKTHVLFHLWLNLTTDGRKLKRALDSTIQPNSWPTP